MIGVLKGIKQVLEERGVQYSTAPGESGCQQAKVRQKANDERRRLHINDDELTLNDNMIEYMNDNVTYDDDVAT